MNNEPIVFIVDDDPSVRRALRLLFETEHIPTQSFASAREFLDAYDPGQPGCLLADLRMPELSGLELQEHLAKEGVVVPIILMTAYADVRSSVRAMKAGAVDFVEKPFNEQQLLEAVHNAIERDQQARHARAQREAILRRLDKLTARERQVLELVVAGKTNRQIAEAWGISEKTIKVHRGRVMDKMRADSLPQLVLLAHAAGIDTTNAVHE
jgi:two-component system response regulator FixJ